MLNAVDHIVACHGIDTQPRQAGIDGDITLAGTGIAVPVGNRCGDGQVAITQRGQHGLRDINRPAQIALYRCGVGIATDRDRHGVTRFGVHHFPADRLACRHFRCIDDVVTGHGVDGDGRQRGVDLQVRRIADAVPHGVRRGCAQGVVRLTQRGQIRCRYRQAPAAVRLGCCGVLFAVQGHGDQGAFRKVSAGTADAQILTFLHRVQYVVTTEGTEAHGRQPGIDGHVMGAGSGIARGIGDADADRHGAVAEA